MRSYSRNRVWMFPGVYCYSVRNKEDGGMKTTSFTIWLKSFSFFLFLSCLSPAVLNFPFRHRGRQIKQLWFQFPVLETPSQLFNTFGLNSTPCPLTHCLLATGRACCCALGPFFLVLLSAWNVLPTPPYPQIHSSLTSFKPMLRSHVLKRGTSWTPHLKCFSQPPRLSGSRRPLPGSRSTFWGPGGERSSPSS